MFNTYKTYPLPYYMVQLVYNPYFFSQFPNENIPFTDELEYSSNRDLLQSSKDDEPIQLKDYTAEPFVVNIEEATKSNNTFRTTLWTGSHLQLTIMSINVGEDIGLEVHPTLDQFIRIEEGQGIVQIGPSQYILNFQKNVYDNFAILIPAGRWHNIINTGNKPLKLYSIYAPPQHPLGTVHITKADAQAAEKSNIRNYKNDLRSPNQNKEFTLSELAQYDGTKGKPAYVAVNGIVYDVSGISKWSGGTHYGLTAGKDLTTQFETCHGVPSKLSKLPKVGILKG